jgi:membrane-bound ClpP family serine protease
MSGYGGAHSASPHGHVKSPISVSWVVLSALLIGLGVFMMAYFLVTFRWFYFLGIAPCVAGGLMLFSRRAGLDSA